MARRRERFDRTDVPMPSPRRNLVGAIVCVVVLAVAAVVVAVVWGRVTAETNLGDVSLGDAVGQQAQVAEPAEGYVRVDGVSCTLLLTVDSLDAPASLQAARILAVNGAQGTASLVSVPVDLALTVDGEPTTLSELLSSEGCAACVVPLATAANVSFSDVVVATGDVVEQTADLAAAGTDDLVSSASGLLSQLKTNLDAPGLLDLAETLSSIGVANLATSDAPLVAETTTAEDGSVAETGRLVLDPTQLGVALGALAPVS